MNRKRCCVWMGMLLLTISAAAQTTVTTSGGTTNNIPIFTGSSTLGNSPITVSGGNVGIGATNPGNPLQVGAQVNAAWGNSGGFPGTSLAVYAHNPTSDWSNAIAGRLLIDSGSTGTTNEVGVYGEGNVTGSFNFESISGGDFEAYHSGSGTVSGETGVSSYVENDSGSVGTIYGVYVSGNGNFSPTADVTNNYGIYIGNQAGVGVNNYQIYSDGAAPTYFAGDMGIGTASPSAKLEVDGNIKLTSGSGGSITFPDGTVQSTAYTGVACGGDFAESVDVTGNPKTFTPGDVLVADPNHPGDFLKSSTPYSTAVLGVYSTKPGFVGRRLKGPKGPNEVPMAMVGIVPTKVTAANGPIHVGDLLVSSSIPGYAMKGTDRGRMLGAVIGKALGNLTSGKGVIEVGVTLQ